MSARQRWTGIILGGLLLVMTMSIAVEWGERPILRSGGIEWVGGAKGDELGVGIGGNHGNGVGREEVLVVDARRDGDGSKSFRIVDSVFGVGLPAWISVSGNEVLFADACGYVDLASNQLLEHPRVSSPGYGVAKVAPKFEGADGSHILKLEAHSTCSVAIVGEGGGGIPGMIVGWSPELSGALCGASVESVSLYSDADGVCEVLSGFACVATISDPVAGYRESVRVRAGERVTVIVPSEFTELQLVCEDSGEALSGVQLEFSSRTQRHSAPMLVTTDSHGIARLPTWSMSTRVKLVGGPYRMPDQMADPWVMVNRLEAVYTGASHSIAAEGAVRLSLKCDVSAIELRDGATGGLIKGPVRYGFLRPSDDLRRGAYRLSVEGCEDGVLRVEIPSVLSEEERGSRLLIWPSGYGPEEVLDVAALGSRDRAEYRLRFFKARSRTLRVLDMNGAPVGLPLSIRGLKGKKLYYEGSGRPDSLYGPFDWDGEDLLVLYKQSPVAGGGIQGTAQAVVAEVSRDRLEVVDELTITVDIPVGRIEVHGPLEQLSSVVVVDHSGLPHYPLSAGADILVFEAIPCGAAYVGPLPWARQLWERRFYRLGDVAIMVEKGGVVQVNYNPEWSASATIEGSVRLGSLKQSDLFLVPVYGTSRAPMPLSVSTDWLGLRADGGYSIEVGQPVPRALMLCSLARADGLVTGPGGCILVHEIIMPGQDVSIQPVQPVLSWRGGEWPGPLSVEWTLTEQGFLHVDGAVLGRYAPSSGKLLWSQEMDVQLPAFPAGELRLRVRGAGFDESQAIRLEKGQRPALSVGSD